MFIKSTNLSVQIKDELGGDSLEEQDVEHIVPSKELGKVLFELQPDCMKADSCLCGVVVVSFRVFKV